MFDFDILTVLYNVLTINNTISKANGVICWGFIFAFVFGYFVISLLYKIYKKVGK